MKLTQEQINTAIGEITSRENKDRKRGSMMEFEVYNSKIYKYVYDYIKNRYGKKAASTMPIVACMNICKKVIKSKASIYKRPPKRIFINVTEKQKLQLEEIYKKIDVDNILKMANRYYCLQYQHTLQVIPKDKNILIRNLKNHTFDVLVKKDSPEEAQGYILNRFDKKEFETNAQNSSAGASSLKQTNDGYNQSIADSNDYDYSGKVIWWTDEENLVTDEKGNVDETRRFPNEIGELPFIDIAGEKDDEFFVRCGNPLVDFTIQFNSALSSNQQIVDMQGFAIGWIKGPKEQITANMVIGPASFIHLIDDPATNMKSELGFANPNSDLKGVKEHLESLLATYLSTEGLDTKTVSTGNINQNFSSGLERLLSMIDQFEASQDDIATFEKVEKKLFRLIAKWINVSQGSDVLGDEYKIGVIPEDATVSVQYSTPEMIQTQKEKTENIVARKEAKLITHVEAIMEDRGVGKDEAEKIKKEIDQERGISVDIEETTTEQETNQNEDEDEADEKNSDREPTTDEQQD